MSHPRGICFALVALAALTSLHASATQLDILGPAGSGTFGASVASLPNGNIVVVDPTWSTGLGAVYLYKPDGTLISKLAGNGGTGGGGIVVLPGGNFLVLSPDWKGPPAFNGEGAVTWIDGNIGLNGTISSANSLVGGTTRAIGKGGVVVLANGNYVVLSGQYEFSNYAATWGSGTSGISGVVSSQNSYQSDQSIFGLKALALPNGNYVIQDSGWQNGAGAVTWANGNTGTTGTASAGISLVGTNANDAIGAVTVLANGNYVVSSPVWDYGSGVGINAGAVTWVSGATGLPVGSVSSSNSLVGVDDDDEVGNTVVPLPSGNYVVVSPHWKQGVDTVGAVTWVEGSSPTAGAISALNSLIGSPQIPYAGLGGVTVLANGNYVALTDYVNPCAATWADGNTGTIGVIDGTNSLLMGSNFSGNHCEIVALANGNYVAVDYAWGQNLGAVTFAKGDVGVTGTMSAANSLTGSNNTGIFGGGVGGGGVIPLSNGNYVVCSPIWKPDFGSAKSLGAVTWIDGQTGLDKNGVIGIVSASNSLIGTTDSDQVCSGGTTALANGNYVVNSPHWDNGAITDAGAVTWLDGSKGVADAVSSANSLVGASAGEGVGSKPITKLSNGNYVISNDLWDNGAVSNVGAVTWGSGASGTFGIVASQNSLVGAAINDQVGSNVIALPYGHFLVKSPFWQGVGAITLLPGSLASVGGIPTAASVIGSATGKGNTMTSAYDAKNERLVVGRPANNIVSILTSADEIFIDGFDG